MKATDLLLITTRLTAEDLSGAEGLRVRQRMLEASTLSRRLGLNLVLVLGPAGDEVLRCCPDLESCEMVFDPNYNGALFSGIHAGLHAACGMAFIWPIESQAAEAPSWTALITAAGALPPDDPTDVLYLAGSGAESDHIPSIFPQLVTLGGLKRLRRLSSQTVWGDSAQIRSRPVATNRLESVVKQSPTSGPRTL